MAKSFQELRDRMSPRQKRRRMRRLQIENLIKKLKYPFDFIRLRLFGRGVQ
jgi:hypothetical protein